MFAKVKIFAKLSFALVYTGSDGVEEGKNAFHPPVVPHSCCSTDAEELLDTGKLRLELGDASFAHSVVAQHQERSKDTVLLGELR